MPSTCVTPPSLPPPLEHSIFAPLSLRFYQRMYAHIHTTKYVVYSHEVEVNGFRWEELFIKE